MWATPHHPLGAGDTRTFLRASHSTGAVQLSFTEAPRVSHRLSRLLCVKPTWYPHTYREQLNNDRLVQEPQPSHRRQRQGTSLSSLSSLTDKEMRTAPAVQECVDTRARGA